MRKIREALRLKAAGLTMREVAANIGAAPATVHEYLVRAETAGLSWPLPEDLDEEALEARLFPPPTAGPARPVPDWREVHRELRSRKHVTLRLVWLEWKAEHPDGWGYSQFCSHYDRWLGSQEVVMRLSYPAGERTFVDFSGDKVPVTDLATGEVAQAEVFVAVLGASGMLYVEATPDQALASWLMAHVHAFEAYGGVTVATTPDYVPRNIIGDDNLEHAPEKAPCRFEAGDHGVGALAEAEPDIAVPGKAGGENESPADLVVPGDRVWDQPHLAEVDLQLRARLAVGYPDRGGPRGPANAQDLERIAVKGPFGHDHSFARQELGCLDCCQPTVDQPDL